MGTVLKLDPDFYSIAEKWIDTIGGSNCLIVKNLADMEYIRQKNPEWYESLKSYDIKNVILFPLKFGNELLGFIWATNFDAQKADQIKETMELTTYFVASSIANYKLLRKLKIMGSVDMLTGVLNRNEMNERVDRIVSGEDVINNLGIVFADINGLKRINDDQGHFAGDQLLKHAAQILRDIFTGSEVFRAGGDEFMIIVPDTDIEQLEQKCLVIKESELGFGQACFATGLSFVKRSRDIRKAMHEADERMYLDKAQFYEDHPELKR